MKRSVGKADEAKASLLEQYNNFKGKNVAPTGGSSLSRKERAATLQSYKNKSLDPSDIKILTEQQQRNSQPLKEEDSDIILDSPLGSPNSTIRNSLNKEVGSPTTEKKASLSQRIKEVGRKSLQDIWDHPNKKSPHKNPRTFFAYSAHI